jgi:hypothetical protein
VITETTPTTPDAKALRALRSANSEAFNDMPNPFDAFYDRHPRETAQVATADALPG